MTLPLLQSYTVSLSTSQAADWNYRKITAAFANATQPSIPSTD